MGVRSENVSRNINNIINQSFGHNEIMSKYFELNELSPLNNVVLKKNSVKKPTVAINTASSSATLSNPTNGVGNPIFEHNPNIYEEYLAQKRITEQTFPNNIYLLSVMHIIHRMDLAAKNNPGMIFNNDNREKYLPKNFSTLENAKQFLKVLELLGYLDIAKKRQKYHDYKLSAKAYEDWSRLKLYTPYSSLNNYRAQEHYLFPFDAKVLLDNSLSGNPEEIYTSFKESHVIPYEDSYITISGSRSGVDMIDYRDNTFNEKSISSIKYKQLFNYIDAPNIALDINKLVVESQKRGAVVTPEYFLDNSIVFTTENQQKFIVPDNAIKFIYNQYFNEDITLSVVKSDTRPSSSFYNHHYGYMSRNATMQGYILVAKRKGSILPLFSYRFIQNDSEVGTIN